jgi:hypothetical protein
MSLVACESLTDVDIVHDHTILGPLIGGCMRGAAPPVVTTKHGPFTSTTRRIFAAISGHSSIIAIRRPSQTSTHSADRRSESSRSPCGHVPTKHHTRWLPRLHREESPDKGAHRAIRIARAVGRPLRLVTAPVDMLPALLRLQPGWCAPMRPVAARPAHASTPGRPQIPGQAAHDRG